MFRHFFVVLLLLTACDALKNEDSKSRHPKLFDRLSSRETGIDFRNTLKVLPDFDVFRYHNFYNGGGVGIGDINNDGLPDLFFTSNMESNKLYLNKGDWKFEDITEKAGVRGSKMWSTGVSIADVNGDGLLDIYVCNAGDLKGNNRQNELFINNGDLTFSESAQKYGLDDNGFSTHAVFFDYDKDGDLDCYVLNNSYRPVSSLGYRNLRNIRDPLGGHKLYRNDQDKFVDVSEAAGIFGSVIGFGLGAAVGDINNDNWPDLYVSNDFYERDYLYINNHDGTFSEKLESHIGHISMFSMGADIADLNNDGLPDIFSSDMLPNDDYRLKTITSFETYDVYQLRLKNDYYHQYMRNMLHMNNGNGTFTEIGQMAGVNATDWSWGALIADFDNNRNKEIYVCNGIFKDITNQDFVEFLGSGEQMRAVIEGREIDYQDLIERMPSVKLSNYMFRLKADHEYENVSKDWGLDKPGFSNGAAYGDLDNDGDLDIVVNNVNDEAFVYRNKTKEITRNNYLSFSLTGVGKNPFAVGAQVKIYNEDEVLTFDHFPNRGFQSSIDYKIIAGLGDLRVVDSVVVTWPDDRMTIITNVAVNQQVILEQKDAKTFTLPNPTSTNPLLSPFDHPEIVHVENDFNDFDRDRLLYHMLSTQGPAFAVADLNGDGNDDFYLGGSIGGTAQLFLQTGSGFKKIDSDEFDIVLSADDTDAVFFDADNDGDNDLYVVSGGSENLSKSIPLLDRYYENLGLKDGVPVFRGRENKLPPSFHSGSCVRPADVDGDGDLDLFIGTRAIPTSYGLPPDQLLLINDGNGNFEDATSRIASQLIKLGMVTDAQWFNYDGDSFPDLIVVGEWMPVTIFSNDGKQLTKVDNIPGLQDSDGMWNRIKVSDLDNDGDIDFVIGNLGWNSKLRPREGAPLSLYVNDFDDNGSVEPIFTYKTKEEEFPFALRPDLLRQLSSLKKQFVYYRDYADKTLDDIFNEDVIKKSTRLKFSQAATSILINEGSNGFKLIPLPDEAQVSPVYGISVADVNHDSFPDIILGGNLFAVKPEAGRYDGLHGLVLTGDGKGNFTPLRSHQSGLLLTGEIRHIALMNSQKEQIIAFILNNGPVSFYTFNTGVGPALSGGK